MLDTYKPAQTCLQPKLLASMDLSHLSYNHILLGRMPANIVTLCPLHPRHCWGEEVASNPPLWLWLCRVKAKVWVNELIGHCLVWSPSSLQSRGRGEHPSGLGPCDLPSATWGKPAKHRPHQNLVLNQVYDGKKQNKFVNYWTCKSLTELKIVRQVIHFMHRLYLF